MNLVYNVNMTVSKGMLKIHNRTVTAYGIDICNIPGAFEYI
jgi:hypothetical protein